ncbi:glycoside hydrolase family 16 protein [Russula ochroleuca]|uniref:Glycoside hydrolase family 16 protein n=1 Tax=Russula ochroleuca TaxID=152965 RepID=A0A9P5TD39_9AGAM|nr:glycoside hydrolase family 16 protein [Russula ochroleuca]
MLFLSFGVFTSLVSSAAAFDAVGGSLRVRHALHEDHGKRFFNFSSVDRYRGEDFFDDTLWSFITFAGPSGGQVKYMSGADAQAKGLAYVQPDGKAVLRVDSWTNLPFGAPRDSVRISSMKAFNHGLVVADFASMPSACSVWAAFWTNGPNWPHNTGPLAYSGEVYIVEGVNLKSSLVNFLGSPFYYRINLRSTPARNQECSVPKQAPVIGGDRAFTAEVLNTNCSSLSTSDTGCSFCDPSIKSFGQGFNDAGGGVFALLRNRNGFKIWFFERQSIPNDISSGHPDPYSWAPPNAFLSADDCNVDSYFSPQTLILDTAICGGWASSDYPNSGCGGNCAQQVTSGNNFVNATWVINYIDVYN